MNTRIIQAIIAPTGESQVSIIPNGAVIISKSEGIFIDYITDTEEVPENAVYVGRMENDGTITDVIGTDEGFNHSFLGWEKKAVPEEVTPVEPV